jgi:cytochrome P450
VFRRLNADLPSRWDRVSTTFSLESRYRDLIRRSYDFPSGADVVFVTTFREALEVLRSPLFAAVHGVHDVIVHVAPGGNVTIVDSERGSQSVHSGESAGARAFHLVLKGEGLKNLRGLRHRERRRALSPLVGRDAHVWFGNKVLTPAIERNLSAVLRAANGELPRMDLVTFSRRLFVQVAASLIGYDGADTPQTVERLIALHQLINGGERLVQALPRDERLEELMTGMIAAKREMLERFHNPSLERRRLLLDAHARGQVTDSDIPHDFLTMVARGSPEFSEPETALNTALMLLSGVVGTNSDTLSGCFADLSAWFDQHPSDWDLRTDPRFLERALNESLRLRVSSFAVPRVALEDVTLTTGTAIATGQYVALLRHEIGRDPEAFGSDADTWNPWRLVPTGVYPFGLGFGSGVHMCLGLPLVLGQGGLSGMQVPVLAALFAIGARPDPDLPAVKVVELKPITDAPPFQSLPVVLTEPRPSTPKRQS